MRSSLKRFSVVIALSGLLTGISGCDFISPSTPDAALSKMNDHVADGKPEAAIEVGQKYLSKYADPDGRVNAELGELFLKKGDAANAAKHLQRGVTTDLSVSESTEIRVEKRVSGSNSTQSQPKTQNHAKQSSSSVSVDGAHVITGPNGTEVRAGDAVVRTPK